MPAQKEAIKNRVFITSCPLCTLDMVRAWGFEPQRIAAQEPKGITFNITSEAEAIAYLHQNNNYFKLTSYRKNYTKYTSGEKAGKYENLDFAYLVELARIDVQLRHIILAMCLDIEHFLKVQLIRAVEMASGEDGYSIVADFVFDNGNQSFSERAKNASQRSHTISNKLEYNKSNPYCGGLISKYHDNRGYCETPDDLCRISIYFKGCIL